VDPKSIGMPLSHREDGLSAPIPSFRGLNASSVKGFDLQSPFSVRGALHDGNIPSWNAETRPLTVRKKMNFGGEIEYQEIPSTEYTAKEESSPTEDSHVGPDGNEDLNDSHNTSLSSLSMEGVASHGKTPAFTRHNFKGRESYVRGVGQHYGNYGSAVFPPSGTRSMNSAFQYPVIHESGNTSRGAWMSPIVAEDSARNTLESGDIAMRDASDDDEAPSLRTRLNFNTLFSPGNDGDVGIRKRHSIGDEYHSHQEGK
jgi:hypothetical protein